MDMKTLVCIILLTGLRCGAEENSMIRQNFALDIEVSLNRLINMFQYSSLNYLSMASHFGRDDVALFKLKRLFQDFSNTKRQKVEKIVEYQNLRGGRVMLKDVKKPEKDDWNSAEDSMQSALQLEKEVMAALLNIIQIGINHGDHHLLRFMEDLLEEQVQTTSKLGGYVTSLRRAGRGLGEIIFEELVLADKDKT
uniref:ferritin, higher subunit-like isoform X2 n=1 Tax=Myxine glutinosa TaxID=7769 RepID=UPI00358EB02A